MAPRYSRGKTSNPNPTLPLPPKPAKVQPPSTTQPKYNVFPQDVIASCSQDLRRKVPATSITPITPPQASSSTANRKARRAKAKENKGKEPASELEDQTVAPTQSVGGQQLNTKNDKAPSQPLSLPEDKSQSIPVQPSVKRAKTSEPNSATPPPQTITALPQSSTAQADQVKDHTTTAAQAESKENPEDISLEDISEGDIPELYDPPKKDGRLDSMEL
ncbi:hypothetical protein BGZ65_000163 [Modicella reniformis]|uniref:Uncharacterized protein n=1 Tax=Modicella reniformis TaxID=1440133 RepID=A0A9P6IHY7_9FUNG|nr:hypothetical protein BGZ65_000163 [Modicella reniformis]